LLIQAEIVQPIVLYWMQNDSIHFSAPASCSKISACFSPQLLLMVAAVRGETAQVVLSVPRCLPGV